MSSSALRAFSPGSAVEELALAPLLGTVAVSLLAGFMGAVAVAQQYSTRLRYNVRAHRKMHARSLKSLGLAVAHARRTQRSRDRARCAAQLRRL
jgi:hypothetical protein